MVPAKIGTVPDESSPSPASKQSAAGEFSPRATRKLAGNSKIAQIIVPKNSHVHRLASLHDRSRGEGDRSMFPNRERLGVTPVGRKMDQSSPRVRRGRVLHSYRRGQGGPVQVFGVTSHSGEGDRSMFSDTAEPAGRAYWPKNGPVPTCASRRSAEEWASPQGKPVKSSFMQSLYRTGTKWVTHADFVASRDAVPRLAPCPRLFPHQFLTGRHGVTCCLNPAPLLESYRQTRSRGESHDTLGRARHDRRSRVLVSWPCSCR